MITHTWPEWHLLGGFPYRDAASHSDVHEFRARMKRRHEDAERARREQARREAHKRPGEERTHE